MNILRVVKSMSIHNKTIFVCMQYDTACFPNEFLFLSNFLLSYGLTVRSKTVMLKVRRTDDILKDITIRR